MSGRSDDDDDEDYHDEMTSFGSGYYDNDDDDGVRDDSEARRHGPVDDVWPPASSSSSSSSSSQARPALHVDDLDRRLDDNHRPRERNLKDVSRSLSTTPRARTMLRDYTGVSPTRRGYVERRRPVGSVTSSSSAAARRRYYVDNIATSGATATLLRPLYTLSSFVAAILFSSAHVFLPLPVIVSPVS